MEVGKGQRSLWEEMSGGSFMACSKRCVKMTLEVVLQRRSTTSPQPQKATSEGIGAARCRQDPANATESICDLN